MSERSRDENTTTFESRSPVDGATVWRGEEAGQDALAAVMSRARSAQPGWSSLPVDERLLIAEQFATLVADRVDELAELITAETGKLRWDARTEAGLIGPKVDLSIAAMRSLDEPEVVLPRGHGVTARRPLGVVAVLGPFNFPAHLPNGQIVPALLAGNAVVFKPSEKSPAVGQWLVERWHEAGCPPGVVQLVQGGTNTARSLIHADIDGLLFTGSHRAGVDIHRELAGRPEVLLALEMGGNSPVVVHPSAEPHAAAYHSLISAFISSGQRCTCARRLILPYGTDDVVNDLAAMVRRTIVGLPKDRPEAFVGPLIDPSAAERLLLAQATLLEQGAAPIVPCVRADRCDALVTPGLIDASNVEHLEDEEVFGPLLVIRRVDTLDAAYVEAGSTRFGLAGALLGGDATDFAEFARRVPVGVAVHNAPTTGASAKLPFGGLGASGNHRPAGYHMTRHVADAIARVRVDRLSIPEQPPPGVQP